MLRREALGIESQRELRKDQWRSSPPVCVRPFRLQVSVSLPATYRSLDPKQELRDILFWSFIPHQDIQHKVAVWFLGSCGWLRAIGCWLFDGLKEDQTEDD